MRTRPFLQLQTMLGSMSREFSSSATSAEISLKIANIHLSGAFTI
jgi:hypothetical protein